MIIDFFGGKVELKSGFTCEDGESGWVATVVETVTMPGPEGVGVQVVAPGDDVFVPGELRVDYQPA